MPNASFWWMIFSLRFIYFWIVPWQRIGLFYWSARHYVWWLNKRTPIKRRTKMYGSTNGVHAWNYMHEILCGSFCYGSILRLPQIWNRHLITYSNHIIKKWKGWEWHFRTFWSCRHQLSGIQNCVFWIIAKIKSLLLKQGKFSVSPIYSFIKKRNFDIYLPFDVEKSKF